MAVTSASNAWMAGSWEGTTLIGHTLILHWNGAKWTRVASPNPGGYAFLNSVAAASAGNAWAAGGDSETHGDLLHWNGTKWTVVPGPAIAGPGTDGYTGVAVTSPRLAWAVGSAISSHITRSVIIRWSGKTWQQVSAPNPDAVNVHENLSRIDITISMTGDGGGSARLGEADVQEEVPEPQVECSAAGPVHDEGQQDDGQDYHDHPEEEHDDAGDGTPGYSSSSSHGRQLPTAVRLIRRQGVSGMLDRPNLRPDDNLHPPRSGALRAIRCLV
jgi:hypothetical protein